jgi:hypothetical protein
LAILFCQFKSGTEFGVFEGGECYGDLASHIGAL